MLSPSLPSLLFLLDLFSATKTPSPAPGMLDGATRREYPRDFERRSAMRARGGGGGEE